MSADLCLFCNSMEKCNSSTDTDLICSRCFQILREADQQDLKRAYEKALSLSKCPPTESKDESLIEWKNKIQEKNIRLGLSFSASGNNALQKKYLNKAKAIQIFILPEEINVRKTKMLKRDMARKRPMRTVRPSRNQLRQE